MRKEHYLKFLPKKPSIWSSSSSLSTRSIMLTSSLLMLSVCFPGVCANPDAKRLYDDLISRYNKLVRPVMNVSEPLTVHIKLKLSQLIEVNLKNQIMTTNLWVEQYWHDYKLAWDPREYGGVDMLHVPSDHIWRPDIVLYNNADGNFEVTLATKAILNSKGFIQWKPPAIYKSSCEIDVEYFPFDEQTCIMKFGSWTYDGFQVDLRHRDEVVNTKEVELGIDLTEFYLSVEWDILEVPAVRNEKFYTCCVEPYIDITFNISMRRKTLFYTVNLIIPCMGISFLTVLVFYLPSDSGEKVALSVSILVSLTVFFLLLAEIIPSTSLVVPLLGKYLLFTMILVTLSICVSVVVLNVHFRSPATHKMAPWVKRVFIHILPRMLLMKRPPYSGNPSEISVDIRKASDYRHRPHHHSSALYFPPPEEVDLPPKSSSSKNSLKVKGKNVVRDDSSSHPPPPSPRVKDMSSSCQVFPDKNSHSRSLLLRTTNPGQTQQDDIHNGIQRGTGDVLMDVPRSPRTQQLGSSRESIRRTFDGGDGTLSKDSIVDHSPSSPASRNHHHNRRDHNIPSPPPPPASCRMHGLSRLPPLPPPVSLELDECEDCNPEVHMIIRDNHPRHDRNEYHSTLPPPVETGCPDCTRTAIDIKPVRRIHFCPEFLRAMESVQFIADHTRKSEEDVDVKEDWKYVAMVLDRLFLWIFTVAVFVGTCGIILHAPTLYDNREPIDIKLSEVALAILNSRKNG